jgi:hypothetical protein
MPRLILHFYKYLASLVHTCCMKICPDKRLSVRAFPTTALDESFSHTFHCLNHRTSLTSLFHTPTHRYLGRAGARAFLHGTTFARFNCKISKQRRSNASQGNHDA